MDARVLGESSRSDLRPVAGARQRTASRDTESAGHLRNHRCSSLHHQAGAVLLFRDREGRYQVIRFRCGVVQADLQHRAGVDHRVCRDGFLSLHSRISIRRVQGHLYLPWCPFLARLIFVAFEHNCRVHDGLPACFPRRRSHPGRRVHG